jgi:hypothetical protein
MCDVSVDGMVFRVDMIRAWPGDGMIGLRVTYKKGGMYRTPTIVSVEPGAL